MKIAVDVDEVLYPLVDNFIIFLNTKYGASHNRADFKTYRFSEAIGGTEEDAIKKYFEFHESDFSREIKPINGSIEGINILREKHDLSIVTSRQSELVDRTIDWLKTHFDGCFSQIKFCNHYARVPGLVSRKSVICREICSEYLIDDNFEYAKECSDIGVKVLLMDAPWNRGKEMVDGMDRVYGWSDIVERF